WKNQTSAAATRRVLRSLCRAWKKRGEGRGPSKGTGTPGSSHSVLSARSNDFSRSFCSQWYIPGDAWLFLV
ncbi:hypothetical protein WH47_12616, partial [Habropoda laboriosa]